MDKKYRLEVTEFILKTPEEREKEREEGRKSRPYGFEEYEARRFDSDYKTERTIMVTLNEEEMERVKTAVIKEI